MLDRPWDFSRWARAIAVLGPAMLVGACGGIAARRKHR